MFGISQACASLEITWPIMRKHCFDSSPSHFMPLKRELELTVVGWYLHQKICHKHFYLAKMKLLWPLAKWRMGSTGPATVVICYLIWLCDIAVLITYLISARFSQKVVSSKKPPTSKNLAAHLEILPLTQKNLVAKIATKT